MNAIRDAGSMADETDIEALRVDLLDAILADAPFDGWTQAVIDRAVAQMPQAVPYSAALIFPRGVRDVLEYWSARADARMRAAYEALNEKPPKIREKITWLVRTRIELLAGHREAARRASATLALPGYLRDARKMTWASADMMWRSIGDQTTDFNYYTKRATLSVVYLSTLMKWYADGSDQDATEPYAASWAFLEDRIDNVMQFEKLKAKARTLGEGSKDVLGTLARWRYGPGKP